MFDLINHLNITLIMITTFNLVNHDKNIKTYRVGTLNRANHKKRQCKGTNEKTNIFFRITFSCSEFSVSSETSPDTCSRKEKNPNIFFI